MKAATLIILLMLAMGMLTGCQLVLEQPPEASMAETITGPALDADTVADLESLIKNSMAEIGVPGLAVGIVLDGKLVYANGFGVTEIGGNQPVTSQSIFQLSSIAKTATSTIMQLAEEGRID